MLSQLKMLCRSFGLSDRILYWKQITKGHIHLTFHVICEGNKEYLIQKINSYVFSDPEQIMHNIALVTQHLRQKNASGDRRNYLHYYQTIDGAYVTVLLSDEGKEYWRICDYIGNSIALDRAENSRQIYQAGRAFGRFQAQLADFNGTQLMETIPHFHDTSLRVAYFFHHAAMDTYQRCKDIRQEIDWISQYAEEACELTSPKRQNPLPLRVTHNDTKFNNILFDKDTFEPLAVIDLDTVMPGLAAYDFGDAIRSGARTADNTQIDFSFFQAFTRGFLQETVGFLTVPELASLVSGTAAVTFELAVRYLDDYITGDYYFHPQFPEQNRKKGRQQLELFLNIQKHKKKLEMMVQKELYSFGLKTSDIAAHGERKR